MLSHDTKLLLIHRSEAALTLVPHKISIQYRVGVQHDYLTVSLLYSYFIINKIKNKIEFSILDKMDLLWYDTYSKTTYKM